MLIVHDRRYQEWTFVTGGCRRREVINPLRCAVRELEEETRGTVNLKRGTYSYFQFATKYKGPGDSEADIEDDVTSIYHVYVIDLPLTPIELINKKRETPAAAAWLARFSTDSTFTTQYSFKSLFTPLLCAIAAK